MIAVTLHNKKQLGEIQVKALEEYFNYIESTISQSPCKNIQEARKYISQKTNAVFQMIMKISALLNPVDYDPKSFKKMLEETDPSFDPKIAEQISHLYEETIDTIFANEITSLYYLNLRTNSHFQVMQPMKYYSIKEKQYFSRLSNGNKSNQSYKNDDIYSLMSNFYPLLPKERLILILIKINILENGFQNEL